MAHMLEDRFLNRVQSNLRQHPLSGAQTVKLEVAHLAASRVALVVVNPTLSHSVQIARELVKETCWLRGRRTLMQ